MENSFQLVLAAETNKIAALLADYPIATNIAFVFAVFVLPFILSKLITNSLRLPALSGRMGIALAATIAAALFVTLGELRYSSDMKGGTTLIYNIIKSDEVVNPTVLASSLSQRIDSSGTQEITIRPRGSDQIEITVPTTDEYELQQIKNRITTSGQLEFRVVANTRDHSDIIGLARAQASLTEAKDRTKADVRDATGRVVGRWYAVGRAKDPVEGVRPLQTSVDGYIIRNSLTGQLVTLPQLDTTVEYPVEKFLKTSNIESVDVLMALELAGRPYTQVFGDDLSSATMTTSNMGEPIVAFKLSATGAGKMLELTSSIMPVGNFFRHMAIVMDGNVLSAPQLRNAISSGGEISGRFTREEVEFLVNILREGKLPAALEKIPASESRVGAGLGEVTIAKGKTAAIIAIVATAVSMLAYYLFSGVVAAIALTLNVMMIFGVMIFIRQPLSLPGLAGIVLTIGMAVDANVLIFERIREERAKGAADRLSVRNGFDRASATIFDANITTLIASIVLYWIGTEQVRGFAITLTIGILCSMFTAVFVSRIIFEVCERLKWVNLAMVDGIALTKGKIIGERDIDYMSARKVWITITVVTTIIGLVAAFARGPGLLNIDFTGGTSVTFQTMDPVPVQEMRELTRQIFVDKDGKPIETTLIRIDQDPKDQLYTLTTSLDDEKVLAQMLADGLAKNKIQLTTYDAKFSKLSSDQSSVVKSSTVRLVSMQAQETVPPTTQTQPAETSATPAAQTAPATTPADAAPATTAPVTTAPAADAQIATAVPTKVSTKFVFELFQDGGKKNAKLDLKSLTESLEKASKSTGVALDVSKANIEPSDKPDNWLENQKDAYVKWNVDLPLSEDDANKVMTALSAELDNTPVWLSLSQIKGRVASEMKSRAVAALLVSLLGITIYIWFRFQKISYGLAAVLALIHDVFFTLGIIALTHWLADYLGFLLVEDFKIGLTEIAAFLAIIGYSLNDTIVIFDRIREIRGRSPRVSVEMLNAALNQTLSRTILTSGTTLLTVFVLYVWGGEGIHTFAFALLIGISVGTYSSMFVAAPLLFWLSGREAAANK